MDSEEKWWPPNFAVSMMELALESLQVKKKIEIMMKDINLNYIASISLSFSF